ncbi:hypothetical protein V492_02866 [Pseudogymnoascus sp. VKM F-4246]|nr:hypothetical protein V492_02866 [Pseudogymnoascus sp. VKM F-4246]
MAAVERARLRMANLGDEMALCFDDEVICEESDGEDSPLAKVERQKRREAIELRYLAGHAPLIMSAQLRGPFDKNNGWVNPWRSKRPTRKQPANRTTSTEPLDLAHKTASVASLGKRSRNDSNASSSVSMRTKALTECSSTEMDIVDNRQPERPQLHSGSKRVAVNQFERPTHFASLNERKNILQKPNAVIKRRADTNWLRGADVGKRSRNNWSDPTSPTPKERTRGIISNDKAIMDASSMPMSDVNVAKYNRQLPVGAANLSGFEDAPTSPADFSRSKRNATQMRGEGDARLTHHVASKPAEANRRGISMGSASTSRSPSECRMRPSNSERPFVELASDARSMDGDGSDSDVEIGRTAPEYSLNRSSFEEPGSSFGHKSVQSCALELPLEPSPVHHHLRSQLSQEILYGLSQASQLARSAERRTPLKLDDSTLVNVEQHPSDTAKRNDLLFSSKKTPLQIASASLNHTSQTRSQSHPLPKSPVEMNRLKPKGNDRSRSFDSPLPPGSLKYRRVKRKAPSPVEGRQDYNATVIGRQKTPEEAPLQPTEVSGQQPTNSLPIIEITDNDAFGNSEAIPLDTYIEVQAPAHTSVPPASPVIKDGVNEVDAGEKSCPKLVIENRRSESGFEAPAMDCPGTGEEGLLTSQQAPGNQPPPETTVETNSGGTEHKEEALPSTATVEATEEQNFGDATLSQDQGSPLEPPDLTDNESTLGQVIQLYTVDEPSSKSSPLPPLPDVVDDDQVSEASFTSALEESNPKSPTAPTAVDDDQVSDEGFTSAAEEVDSLPAPQSPWIAEEVTVPQALPAEPTVGPANFSMSQSKDAALLLADAEPHRSAAISTNSSVELSAPKPGSANGVSETPQSKAPVLGDPVSSGLMPIDDALSPSKSHTPQPARVKSHDLNPLSNPWANSTQSPIVHPRSVKRKKRVSFNPMPLDSDNEDKPQPNANAPERDLSSPPPPPEAESLAEGDNAFHRKLKWTSGILSKRASKDRFVRVSGEGTVPPASPGVGAMAEAFLAADVRIQSADDNSTEEHIKRLPTASEKFDLVEDVEQQDRVVTASAVRAIPLMTESQLVNPWDDDDEAPPFSMADCVAVEDDGLVEDVLSDMDAMLGDWNVDAELDRAKREGRSNMGRDVTARERLVETGY